tara:strand:- start:1295 stop:1642 length:348 start_codon:yes stop_codon:yes gene_type:complete
MMKNQEQFLLSLLLLALTSMAAVAGGMNTTEPFFNEEDLEDPDEELDPGMEPGMDQDMDEKFENQRVANLGVESPGVENPMGGREEEKFSNSLNNASLNTDMPVEGFTGSMYAGF